jgi:DNA-binding transcriptional LysR family regulator
MSLLAELKRRNVVKVSMAYLALGWVVIEVTTTITPVLNLPEWLEQHFPDAGVVLRVDDVTTMLTAVKSGMGLARMPCYVADSQPGGLRLDVALTPSDWGIWILSHVDLRSTERVRVCREFLLNTIEQQRQLVLGETSSYYEPN